MIVYSYIGICIVWLGSCEKFIGESFGEWGIDLEWFYREGRIKMLFFFLVCWVLYFIMIL